jgi:hypothetical protein
MAPCVVVSDGFPAWLLALGSMGLRPVLILLQDPLVVPLVESLTPTDCTMWCSGNQNTFKPDSSLRSVPNLICFSDCRLKAGDFDLFESLSVTSIYTTWQIRGALKTWWCSSATVQHAAVGGVTTHVHTVTGWRPRSHRVWIPPPFQEGIPRDAITVLEATGFAKGTRAASHEPQISPLSAVNLGSNTGPVWHSGGLLLSPLDLSTRILISCLGLPSTIWGLRRLTMPELLCSFDFNDSSLKSTKPFWNCFRVQHLHSLIPLKVLTSAFAVLRTYK